MVVFRFELDVKCSLQYKTLISLGPPILFLFFLFKLCRTMSSPQLVWLWCRWLCVAGCTLNSCGWQWRVPSASKWDARGCDQLSIFDELGIRMGTILTVAHKTHNRTSQLFFCCTVLCHLPVYKSLNGITGNPLYWFQAETYLMCCYIVVTLEYGKHDRL